MKWTKIMIFMLLALSIMAFAIAENDTLDSEDNDDMDDSLEEENDIIDDETESEVDEFESTHGAKVRLLQLERSLTLNIERGQNIVDNLDNVSTTALEDILAEMSLLLREVNALAETGTTPENFVALKHDAIELTQEFKDTLHDMVKEGDVERLRNIASRKNKEDFIAISEKIKELKRKYNAERLEKILDEKADFIEKVKSGEISTEDLRRQVMQKVNDADDNRRAEIRKKISEETDKREVIRRAVLKNAKENLIDNYAKRAEERIKNIENEEMRARLKNTIANRADILKDEMKDRGRVLSRSRVDLIKEERPMADRMEDKKDNHLDARARANKIADRNENVKVRQNETQN